MITLPEIDFSKIFHILAQNPLVSITINKPDGLFLYANQAFCDHLGFTLNEILSTDYKQITYSDDIDQTNSQLKQLINGEIQSYNHEKRYVHKKGHIVRLQINVSCNRDEQGNVIYFTEIGNNISESKTIEQDLINSEQSFRALVENSDDYIFRYDKQGHHLYMNKAGLEISGLISEQVIGKTHAEIGIFDAEQCEFWEEKINWVFENRETYQTQFAWESTKGKIYLDWKLTPEYDILGNIIQKFKKL